ncbi:MAG: hypothetical protein IPM82_29300 [Saprospiraceae bacterium]|nr:hypothetical protein [Saprospiraceae bacterium]
MKPQNLLPLFYKSTVLDIFFLHFAAFRGVHPDSTERQDNAGNRDELLKFVALNGGNGEAFRQDVEFGSACVLVKTATH